MLCRDIAVGWIIKRAQLSSNSKLLLGPVAYPHYFELSTKSISGEGKYSLKVNNTLIRDMTSADETKEASKYYNGLLYPGERLTINASGTIGYTFKYMRKTYA